MVGVGVGIAVLTWFLLLDPAAIIILSLLFILAAPILGLIMTLAYALTLAFFVKDTSKTPIVGQVRN